jgi:type VI protein secretion system component Hcp
MRKSMTIALVIIAWSCLARAQAGPIYLSIPSITGEDPVPGYPGAMAIQGLTVTPNGFSIVKSVDKASPQIVQAVQEGSPLGTATALFYNQAPSGPPVAKLAFAMVLASSYQLMGGGPPLLEKDGFASTTPFSIYLEVPGIAAESSTPGHPGAMAIQSFSLSGNGFSVVKAVDKASPQIVQAVAEGTSFADASVLFYDSTPTGPPDATLFFSNVLASGYQLQGSGDPPLENDSFRFRELVGQSTPEPSSLVLTASGVLGLLCLARRRSCFLTS